MTIASALNDLNTDIINARTAITTKGGTVTLNGGSSQLATDIDTIPAGGGGVGIPREVVNGVYQAPVSSFTFSLPSNATDVGDYALYCAFYNCASVTDVDLSSLTTVSGNYALRYAFYSCTNLTSLDLSSLTTVTGIYALRDISYYCTNLTSLDLSSLTTVSAESAFGNAFRGCTSLTGALVLSNLTTISGRRAFDAIFRETNITSLSFPALTSTSFGSYTDQFNGMISGVTGCTVHFPSNLQAVIGSWSDVSNGFGGTNTIVLFDLPATT